ncbi:MAG: hypothetical protein ABFS18_04205 [Thermodesulfobacteriota bacterium]
MTKASRTLNPLHFEDLEPHRFEDLTRQLIYDLRDWSALEATGRSGGDDGYDVRGIERVLTEPVEDEEEVGVSEKIWLIQCKREKSITPKKIQKYIDECLQEKKESIAGVLFVAPCNLSKKTRDAFYDKMREYDIEDCILWGNGELEDQLFQPKNDHLLFAYFNISLKVHRRSRKSQIRSKLAIKRKALKNLTIGQTVLIRDPEAYSYPNPDEIEDFKTNRPWLVYQISGHYYDGIKILIGRFFAFLDENGVNHDFAHICNDAFEREDHWRKQTDPDIRNKIWEFWDKIPEISKGWLTVDRRIPYENILAIDEDGDEYVRGPHLYVPFTRKNGPFEDGLFATLTTNGYSGRKIYPKQDDRIEYFPEEMRVKYDQS